MSKVILILGSGSNIGVHVSRAFTSQGYKVALAARSLKESDNTPSQIHIQADFSNPNAIITAFSKTKALLGVPGVDLQIFLEIL
jgi:NAD(P)-dependent dehydrogenase (short-subunit alcohol dehydrogenase family)